ncbi:hypothetical protein BH11MYX1_BH11MYX1_07730 [soil metagenome]
MPVTEIAGAPRSLFEIEFVAGLCPCDACGDQRLVAWRTGGFGGEWIVRGACPRCATERSYAFRSPLDLVTVDVGDLELGGAEPSRILEPFELVREVDRLAPSVVLEPERLAGDAWHQNVATLERLRTSLVELAKFLVGDEVPLEAHRSSFAQLDRAMRAERYQRAWIVREQGYWAQVASRVVLDAPRIFAAERRRPPLKPRGTLDGEAFAEHRAWLASEGARGRRLDVVIADASARALRGVSLARGRFEQIRFVGADLYGSSVDGAELVEVDLTAAWIGNATFRETFLVHCDLTRAIAEDSDFSDLRATGCDFTSAKLATSVWLRAEVERCSFFQADLADCALDLGHFTGCDLRGARLSGAVLAGAWFERCDLRDVNFSGCDLRGTTFVQCAFAAAHGGPISTAGWIVSEADFSERADTSDLGDADDLYAELTS